jgi:hypothetical protein
MVFLLIILIPAPILSKILMIRLTSLMAGMFSIRTTSSAKMAAGIMATAAFLAPLIFTSPNSS